MLRNRATETEFFLENSVSLRALYFLFTRARQNWQVEPKRNPDAIGEDI